jgi:hypothetical protein
MCMLKLTYINPINDRYVVRLFDLPIQVVGRLVVDNLRYMYYHIYHSVYKVPSLLFQFSNYNIIIIAPQSQNLIYNHGKSKSFHPLTDLSTQVQQRLFACDQRQSKKINPFTTSKLNKRLFARENYLNF